MCPAARVRRHAPPDVAPAEQLVSRTEETVIDRPLAVVLDVIETAGLEDVIDRSTSLPGVSGTHVLTDGAFGAPGSRRLACLTDASTLVEQVLERTRTDKTYRFRYVVWNYTSPQARPIVYGVGRFLYTDLGGGRTHVTWTYAFQLNRHRFPGFLGGFGDYLFRVTFLDRQYADMKRGTLKGNKARAESGPAASAQ